MASIIDQALGLHARALVVQGKRAETLATNMANADTPGYKARDLDFTAALKDAMEASGPAMSRSNAAHIAPADASGGPRLLYRIPLQPSADGNTVDLQTEQSQFTENAIRHQASFTFLDGTLRNLMSAIKGE
jgi:flagellar basal-body rod protein FlgB